MESDGKIKSKQSILSYSMIYYNLYQNIINSFGLVCTSHEFLKPSTSLLVQSKDWKVSINNAHYQQHFYFEEGTNSNLAIFERNDDKDLNLYTGSYY